MQRCTSVINSMTRLESKEPDNLHPKEIMTKAALKQLRAAGYKPKAIWYYLDEHKVYVATDDIDRSEYAKLIKKFK